MTNALGVASVTATANGTSGVYQVGATFGNGIAGGGPNADVFLLTNGSGLATLTATAGTPQYTFAGQLFPTKLQAKLLDGLGNPISGATVWLSTPFIGGVDGFPAISIGSSAVTDSTGSISFTANAPTNAPAGTFPVTATIGGLTAVFELTVKTPQPVVMSIPPGASPQTTAVGYAFATPLTVQVTDGWGTPRGGVVVTYIPPASAATAALSAGTASTNGSGIASVTAIANNTQGTYNVTASVGGVSVSFVLTNGPAATGPPASVTALAGTPQSHSIGGAFVVAFQVLVKNAAGDPLPGVSVTFSAPSTGPSGTFSGSATILTNGIGVATAPTFTANNVAGSYVVTATAGAASTPFSLTNTGGSAVAMNVYAGNNQSATVSTAFGTPLAVQFVDYYGNPAGSGTDAFFYVTAGTSGASAAFTGSSEPMVVSDNNGVATAPTLTANGATGPFTVTALWLYMNGGTYTYPTVTFKLTNSAAAPANLTAVAGTPQSANTGTAFATALSAQVTDSANNPLAGFTVNFAAPTTGASAALSSASAITNAAGIASVAAVANAVGGNYNVIATIGSLHTAFALTNAVVNRCDINQDKVVDIWDVKAILKEAAGSAVPSDILTVNTNISVVDIQIVTNAALKLGCMAY